MGPMSKPSWRDTYNVHPAADAFPMLSEQELRELGEDIKKNGLKTPILFQGIDGKNQTAAGVVLIDGRNRLEAMELVGIEINHADLKKRTVPHYEDAVSHLSRSTSIAATCTSRSGQT
jgi:ParB-like chromosome segregation protein Spo0J